MDILDDKGVSKLSAKVFFFKVNFSFNITLYNVCMMHSFRWSTGYIN